MATKDLSQYDFNTVPSAANMRFGIVVAEWNPEVADIGHFESEQFTKELFYELLTKKFPKFAVRFSEVNTNPVFYF